MQRAYHASTRVLSALLLLLGLTLLVTSLLRGGGALAVGVVVGLLFSGIGAGRLWISFRGAPVDAER